MKEPVSISNRRDEHAIFLENIDKNAAVREVEWNIQKEAIHDILHRMECRSIEDAARKKQLEHETTLSERVQLIKQDMEVLGNKIRNSRAYQVVAGLFATIIAALIALLVYVGLKTIKAE